MRIVAAEDSYLIRERLRSLIATQPDLELVDTAGSAPEILDLMETCDPDVVITDVRDAAHAHGRGVRTGGAHIARVIGADGATTGVLFLEDVVEELIGKVHDATAC